MRNLLTIGGFVASAILLAMALVLIAALNVLLNGHHPECSIWENIVPLMCLPSKQKVQTDMPAKALPLPSAGLVLKARPSASAQRATRSNPCTGRSEPWGCVALQQEPRRVQCDPGTGACYHDLGLRANCGLAHDWNSAK